MKFDKTRVYTALNADELKVGSKCIFADTVQGLKKHIETKQILTLVEIYEEHKRDRFVGSDGAIEASYSLAYLIEPPVEQRYKPFSSEEKEVEVIKKHGGWIKSKDGNKSFFITGFNKKENTFCFVFEHWHSFNFLFAKFVWADDDSPCGELVKE